MTLVLAAKTVTDPIEFRHNNLWHLRTRQVL
jgi:hypothetical protein